MVVISVQNLSLSFGEETIFSSLSFDVKNDEKIGLVGVNGAGKTSLFKIITGEYTPDSGAVFISKDVKVGYMEQHTCSVLGRSVYDELISVFSNLQSIEEQLEKTNSRLEQGIDIDNNILLQARLQEEFEQGGGLTYKSRTRSALLGLGFSEKDFSVSTQKLSGGQRSKLTLAKLLLSDSDILLLDEPTNHLDISSVEWLEDFILSFKGNVIIVSHDRYFLDKVTNKTIQIENKKCFSFTGNYSQFLDKKEAMLRAIEDKYRSDMQEIQRIEGIVAQQRQWNRERNIKTAESKLKQIERIKEQLVVPDSAVEKIRFDFKPKAESGNDVVTCKGLSKAFGENKLFENVDLQIKKGERVFLLGDNGCGKTTLFKILMGEYASDSGQIIWGENVYKGYYEQIKKIPQDNRTVIDDVWNKYPGQTQTNIRNALASFLFKGDDVFKHLADCSGGEIARVEMLKLMLGGDNFLLLDEPTNHLDSFSREALEKTLSEFDGTLFVVSHDRYFINKLATRVLVLGSNGVSEYLGNYDYYISHKKEVTQPSIRVETPKPKKINDYKLKKEIASNLRKAKNKLNNTEAEIEETENHICDTQVLLNDPEIQSDYEKIIEATNKLEELTSKRDCLYDLWEQLQIEIEEMDNEIK
ncbi:MAG: ABC-F family ATP-binding cassette domain-containing protein [Clostridia bacterium]|nr:ABC-F family ATP-binding cassette domain-containing protein [Clostridia bacterium]